MVPLMSQHEVGVLQRAHVGDDDSKVRVAVAGDVAHQQGVAFLHLVYQLARVAAEGVLTDEGEFVVVAALLGVDAGQVDPVALLVAEVEDGVGVLLRRSP